MSTELTEAGVKMLARAFVVAQAEAQAEARQLFWDTLHADRQREREQNEKEWDLRQRADTRIVQTIDDVIKVQTRMRNELSWGPGEKEAWSLRWGMLATMIRDELPALQLTPDVDVSEQLNAIRERAGLAPLPAVDVE